MDATKFDEFSYKGAVLSSIGYPKFARVEIGSLNYRVDVLYIFDSAVNHDQVLGSVASAGSVPESKVTAILSESRRLATKLAAGRRLPTTADARVSASDLQDVQGITASIGNSSKVQESFKAFGVNTAVTVARSPRHTILVSTRIISRTSFPVSAPDSTILAAHCSSQLGTDVTVTISGVFQAQGGSCRQAVASLFWQGVVLFLACSTLHDNR